MDLKNAVEHANTDIEQALIDNQTSDALQVQEPTEREKQMERQNKKLEREIKALREEHLSKEENTALAQQERETELENREKALGEALLKMDALTQIANSGLVTGDLDPESLLPFLQGFSKAETSEKITTFKRFLDELVQAAVVDRIKSSGRTDARGGTSAGYVAGVAGEDPQADYITARAVLRATEQKNANEILHHYLSR